MMIHAVTSALPGATKSLRKPGIAADPAFITSVMSLIMLGWLMVFSASLSVTDAAAGSTYQFTLRHSIHVLMGLSLMFVVSRVRSGILMRISPVLLVTGIILLILVLLPGIGAKVNGSVRWLNLGLMRVQPSEFMKLFMIIYVAGYVVRKKEDLGLFVPGIVIMSMVLGLVGTLLLLEPDLGTVVVLSITVMTMLYLAGVRFLHFMIVVLTGAGSMALLTWLSPYRMERVTGFLDPWADPFDSGFQLVQALIAFGRGEWFGVGLGASIQKLAYLPAAHTDFLLAVLAEELGFSGILFVIGLFVVLVFRGFHIARLAEQRGDLYSTRLVQGMSLLLGWQAAINMGVNMGMLPTKGLTLPLMSYGGSSMIVSCLAVGMILMVDRENRIAS
ncbi:MAG: putative lipid II flippase FtsW [Gammaproteobacteria bacterium]|nr:putative lipid II flippase FtsW [Gammaproteobacteria bacterium]